MPTPKGVSAKIKGKENALSWHNFVRQCNKDSTWSKWLSGSHLNKTRIAKHLGFSKDVFDDNPAVDIKVVEQELIRQDIINAVKGGNNGKRLSRKDTAFKYRIDEHNHLLSVELSRLLQTLLAKSDEIQLINCSLPDDQKINLNGLIRISEASKKNIPDSADEDQPKESIVLNIQMRELKLKSSIWVKRIRMTEQHLAHSLRIPKWL